MRYYAIPKDYFVDLLIEKCDFRIKVNPNDFRPYIAKSDLYMFKGNFNEAKKGYKKALEIAPFYVLARERLKLIEIKTKRRKRE